MRTILTILGATLALFASAQGPMSLSLHQAMELAAKQSYAVQNSVLEAEKAEARIKEVMAIGLPQIEGSASLNNYINVPTQVIPNFFGGDPNDLLAVNFGLPWNASAGLQLNQLIYDGSYLIGLKATRALRTMSQQDLEKARTEARLQAAKSYLGVLAAREGTRLAAESVPVLEKSQAEAAAMLQAGFMEQTDVDRLSIALASARDRANSFAQQERVALAYLRLVLGVPTDGPLELTDKLGSIVNDAAETSLSSSVLDLGGHIEHQLAKSILEVQELDLRNKKSAYQPKLFGFISHQEQTYSQKFDMGGNWYPATLWGVSLNVPIFSSGLRASQVKQARFAMDQAAVNLTYTEQRLLAEAQERAEKARSAEQTFRTQEQNLDLSRRIFDRTSIKFTNGLSSSFELNQDQSQYLQAQQAYIGSLVDLLLARTDLRKALDLY